MKLSHFKQINFLPAIKALFNELKVPINFVTDDSTNAREILKDTYKDNETFRLIKDVYFVGMVDDAAFQENESLSVAQIKSDYDGILIFGVTLNARENDLLPTRSQLAEISRAFNREFYYTPVVVIFKYMAGNVEYLALSNTERLPYKQEWREGEKAGKVSLLRDINIEKPHRGHEDIIDLLRIPLSGNKPVDSFSKLYVYWQEVFNVNVLNRKFYLELSNWYFWALKHVTFPNKPTPGTAHQKEANMEDLVQEHNATNVIRLLIRILFVWFIKEKDLIPEQLFDLDSLQKELLKEISPYHEDGIFKQANQESIYYKAILQNLFFATLNCPIQEDSLDKRSRRFRLSNHYGQDRGNDWMYRYEKYFKYPDAFLSLMNSKVPFMNVGLFECLDIKQEKNLYIDGFSDQMAKGETLIVPDYLFFGVEEHIDLSKEYGVSSKGTKEAAVKGLINILKSYKFTVTENTSIEQDVALDPELLGKVFENLLASYNPETKTTARKQTGSFYTPREVVDYMVDQSLIAYLKNAMEDWGMDDDKVDQSIRALASFDPVNPFVEDEALTRRIVQKLDECKILDPACGSGAFPMGVLQKMVHILQKLDPNNRIWKDVQTAKAEEELKQTLSSEGRMEREEKLKEINEAFDQSINDPDYARKLYLIENCIYGVDIQPIATQITKLRFFMSLVVDQKPSQNPVENFKIKPLHNRETKFVTANTLITINKPSPQTRLFDTSEIRKLELEFKNIRHRLFSARAKEAKLKYRDKDQELRKDIVLALTSSGYPTETAERLAGWDPYDQNVTSDYFDPEWMFGVSGGFDIVIGNPPYILVQNIPGLQEATKKQYMEYTSAQYKVNLYHLFIQRGIELTSANGAISYITPNTFIKNKHNGNLRKFIYERCHIESVMLFYAQVFESISVDNLIFVLTKRLLKSFSDVFEIRDSIQETRYPVRQFNEHKIQSPGFVFNFDADGENEDIVKCIEEGAVPLKHFARAYFGIQTFDRSSFVSTERSDENWRPVIDGANVLKYKLTEIDDFVKFTTDAIKSGGDPEVYQKDRIVVRQIGRFPEGAFCPRGVYTLNTIYNIFLTTNTIDLLFMLAQINSPVIRYHWLVTNFDNKETFPKIKKAPLEAIPIKISSRVEKIAVALAALIVSHPTHSNIHTLKEVLDALIIDLHFSEHLKSREIDVLDHIEQDFAKVDVIGNTDGIASAEEAVIHELHTIWSNPDNEVRSRIKMFAARSPEILKPILESK